MWKILFLLPAFFILQMPGYAQAVIEITNPLNTDREELISLPWKDVPVVYPDIDAANFIVTDFKTKQQVPYQLEYRGMAEIQNLLIRVKVKSAGNLKLKLKQGKPSVITAKTYARYVPERKDDFAWENDKIAFRMYGKALEGTKENAYGTDVWVKRTDRLIINERYKKGEYHIDHGDGMDYYHVGFSLGAGNMAPYKNDTVRYSKNYKEWKVLDNGPLRSTFQLTFDEWELPATGKDVPQKVKAVKTISLDAGSQMSRVEAVYYFEGTTSMPVVSGIIKRKDPGTALLDEGAGILGYWEPVHGKDGTTGVGCVFTQPVQQMMANKEQFLALLQAKSGVPVIYYNGAAWDRAGVITNSQAWFEYLRLYKQKMENPVKVIIRKD